MSKRGGFPGMGGGFGGMNLNQLMKEAKKMQSDVAKSQEELAILATFFTQALEIL